MQPLFGEPKNNNMEDTQIGKNLPPQGQVGSPRGRRDYLVIVPDQESSLTSYGPRVGLPTSPAPENAIVDEIYIPRDPSEDPLALPTETEAPVLQRNTPAREDICSDPQMDNEATMDMETESETPGANALPNVVPIMISPTDSYKSRMTCSGEKRKADTAFDKSPSSDEIPIASRLKTRTGKQRITTSSEASTGGTMVEEKKPMTQKNESEEEWTSASSSVLLIF